MKKSEKKKQLSQTENGQTVLVLLQMRGKEAKEIGSEKKSTKTFVKGKRERRA